MKMVRNIMTALRKASAYDALKGNAKNIQQQVSRHIKPEKNEHPIESFDALAKEGVDDTVLEQRLSTFKKLITVYLILFLSGIGYAIYQLTKHDFPSVLVATSAALLFLAQAFRYHFWCFQIKTRQLGCTLKDWLNYTLNRNRS